MIRLVSFIPVIVLIITLFGCNKKEASLPILGPREAVQKEENGTVVTDTIYYAIPDFRFIDQDSNWVTPETFKDKIYVADFFFVSCPTICPVMKKQLLRVYDKYKDSSDVLILSHTIDPVHDSVDVLKDFAQRLDVKSSKWHFVTGNKDSIFQIARDYLVSALEDKEAPGGFIHSGALILIDKDRHIRGYYDGTDEKSVDKLMNDIRVLLNEK